MPWFAEVRHALERVSNELGDTVGVAIRYRRYLKHKLREGFGVDGTAIRPTLRDRQASAALTTWLADAAAMAQTRWPRTPGSSAWTLAERPRGTEDRWQTRQVR